MNEAASFASAYPVVHKNIYYCVALLIRHVIHFQPFAEVIHHDENISTCSIADKKRPCYVHRYSLERWARVFLWDFSLQYIGFSLLSSLPLPADIQPNKNVILFFPIFVTPRCPPLAPLWNSFKISFIWEEGTTSRLDKILPSVRSHWRYKHAPDLSCPLVPNILL